MKSWNLIPAGTKRYIDLRMIPAQQNPGLPNSYQRLLLVWRCTDVALLWSVIATPALGCVIRNSQIGASRIGRRLCAQTLVLLPAVPVTLAARVLRVSAICRQHQCTGTSKSRISVAERRRYNRTHLGGLPAHPRHVSITSPLQPERPQFAIVCSMRLQLGVFDLGQ